MAPKKYGKVNPESYPYTECREQHHWQPLDGAIDKAAKMAYRTQKCANCPTRKNSIISMRAQDYGQLIRSSYAYPNDYRVPGGIDIADRGRIRMFNFLAELSGK